MTYLNKHVVHRMEQQYLKNVKHFFLRIQNLNVQLNDLLLNVSKKIDKSAYVNTTDYINQYLVHTDIWRLRFTNNLQNIEIAVLQTILLEQIFHNEPITTNIVQLDSLEDYKAELFSLNQHVPELFNIHRKKLEQSTEK